MGLGQKLQIWDRLQTLTESTSAKEHNINNWKNLSIYKDSPPPNFVNFGPQTAKNDGRVSAHPLTFSRRMSCGLTFARHFGLIMAHMVEADVKSLVSVGEAARQAGSRWVLPCI